MGLQALLGLPDWTRVSEVLAKNYLNNPEEKERRKHCARLLRLYKNRSERDLNVLIEAAFKSEVNRELRKQLVKWCKWNNVTARIIAEKATVYSEPATRTVTANEPYHAFLELVPMDEIMREADSMLALFEDLWIQYRVRARGEERTPVVDLVDPSKFYAVHAPADKTELIAIIVDQSPGEGAKDTEPHFRVWTDDETLQLDAKFRVITGSVEVWPFGKMPGVLATMVPPGAKQCLLAQEPSADLAAAHDSVSFQNLLLLKESKSANRQTFISGDVSRATMGQVTDTERDAFLPEGAIPTTIDRGMDLSQFRDNAKQIFDDAGANHGLPPAVLHHQDAASGAEIEMRRIPIRELRRKRIPVFRRIERRVCEIQAMINAKDLTAHAFSAEGFAVDFGEVQGILTEQEKDAVFEKRRQLLLTDTVEEVMRRNPDLPDREAAVKLIAQRVTNEVARVELQQELMKLNGGTTTEPGDTTPEENGAAGQARTSAPPPRDRQLDA